MGIGIEGGKVEVRVRGKEVKDIVLVVTVPVFPADVPAFYKDAVKAVFCGEVYVAAYVFIVGTVAAGGLCVLVVCKAELD